MQTTEEPTQESEDWEGPVDDGHRLERTHKDPQKSMPKEVSAPHNSYKNYEIRIHFLGCLSNRIYTSCYRKCEVCCEKDSDCDTIVCGEPKCACNNGTALQSASDPQNGIGCIAIEDCKC
ncbi:unnamed protein product [Heligmosomoides polygyrus]|uniref:TIL domain-containing protein n=1 Tax=Heligmosomoides polygyrus TaxID=6339 RepID=A0A183FUE1_HELPZ|nr:unnamed protein product [Heligmosomoides polygyrus]